ncbi:MAG: hypothetical protein BGO05_09715 [Rhizobiales bacterium 63-7]|nr:hypothetical protein [Hyphomicrobiales bacterium]OJU72377.1 MAG: hypothetical protein BGO05_09715 [Rhizobiales bacterium 63-7]
MAFHQTASRKTGYADADPAWWQERAGGRVDVVQPREPRLTDRIGAILTRHDGYEATLSRIEMAAYDDEPADFEEERPPRAARRARPARRFAWGLVAFGAALSACAAIGLWAMLSREEGAPAQAKIALSLDGITDIAEKRAILGDQARVLVAPTNLARVVERAHLDRDPEFSGASGGVLGMLGDLVSGNGDPGRSAEDRLRRVVATEIDARDNAILLTVRSSDAAKSDAIAQEIAASYAEAASGPVRNVDPPKPAVYAEAPRVAAPALDKAEAELAAFTAAGGDKLAEATRLKTELDRLHAENAAAQKRLLEESGKSDAGTLASLLDGSFPPELLTPTLDDLRGRYVSAKLAVEQMAQALGPRHPRLQTAQGQADALKSDLEREIRGVLADARAALQQAQDKAQALAVKSADTAKKLRATGVDVDKLQQLQAAVDAAREARQDSITTASIPAAAAKPVTGMVERIERPAMPPLSGETGAETTVTGLMAILALAVATGAGVIGLTRFARRKLAGTTVDDHEDMAEESRAMDWRAPVHTRAEPDSFTQEDWHPEPAVEDLVQLRRQVAALKQRVQDFSQTRYRHDG